MAVKIKKEDLDIERICRSGPGGQHRNRKATGIRLKHLPSGLVIMSTNERSQKLNLQKAIDTLIARLNRLNRPVKKRIASQPSKRAVRQRIEDKKKQAEKKRLRKPIDRD